jgi:hypothetical protein
MSIRLYGVESALFRTTGLIDERINSSGGSHDGRVMAAALEEFAIEASLLKISSSEMVDYAVDENVQVHGGNGFVADYPAERRYRDARVNRIFEGTNEINRLLVPGVLIKRALKGGLPLMAAAKAVQDELMTVAPPDGGADAGPLANERRVVASLRKTVAPGIPTCAASCCTRSSKVIRCARTTRSRAPNRSSRTATWRPPSSRPSVPTWASRLAVSIGWLVSVAATARYRLRSPFSKGSDPR